jgi:anti-anti-sigma factor
MQVIPDKYDTVLKLTGSLNNSTADELRKGLLEHLEHHARIALNLSKIETCDASGVQLLLAMQKSAEAADKPFSVVAATDAFTTVCATLGISSEQFMAANIPLLEPACTEKETSVA